MDIEADQKHVPRLLEDLGLVQGNVVTTLRVKLSAAESNAIENSSILEREQPTLFRSGTMRCAYFAQDRADISEAIKCLARGMSKPTTGHMIQLKRVARYLPRKAQQYPAQEKSKAHLEVHVDSDWAGDTVTRRSTTGVIVRRGQHVLRHSSTVQSVIALSGAESEYYALTKGGCSGLGLQSLFADSKTWNYSSRCTQILRVQKQLSTRHIQTKMLWLQERVVAKTLTSCESSIRIKSCRHVDESPWKIKKLRNSVQRLDKLNLAQKHWTRNSKESIKPRNSSLRLKQLKWMKRSRTGRKNCKGQEQVEGCKNCKDQERVEG